MFQVQTMLHGPFMNKDNNIQMNINANISIDDHGIVWNKQIIFIIIWDANSVVIKVYMYMLKMIELSFALFTCDGYLCTCDN